MGDVWNPSARSFEEGSRLLKDRVVRCCKEKFRMDSKPDSKAVSLVEHNFPNDFHKLNDKPKGCVKIEVVVTKYENKKSVGSWTIEVDADGKNDKQEAHYGYTVYYKGLPTPIAKFSGHVWLVGLNPPNVRPWKEKIGDCVAMGSSSVVDGKYEYVLTGKMYNQYK